jgi:hypothetical protein
VKIDAKADVMRDVECKERSIVDVDVLEDKEIDIK